MATATRKHQRAPGTAVGTSFHQPRQPTALCIVDPDCPMVAATAIAAQVRAVERNMKGDASLVFISEQLEVYVIPETRPAAADWSRRRLRWWLGTYHPKREVDGVDASIAGLCEDIQQHLIDLGLPG